MKRPLISLFLSLAFCAPAQATPEQLNVKGWLNLIGGSAMTYLAS